MKKIKHILLFIFLIIVTGCNHNDLSSSINDSINNNSKQLIIHYIDVGQGDSIFIELPNNENMLIDAGDTTSGIRVKEYINNLGYNSINYLVGTHPHVDHIGGMKEIIENFDIKSIYMPKASNNTNTYFNLLNCIKNKGLSINTAKKDVNIVNNEDLKISILSPRDTTYNDLNNYSVIIKILYKNRSFLFMGDAEELIENELDSNINVDVIKISHHGSKTSSSINFINKVSAIYGIISVGRDNKYNHPNSNVIDRWINSGTKIYRTDLNGNIILTCDGNNINITTEKNN